MLPSLALGLSSIDVTEAMQDDRNIFYLGEHGGAMFHWSAPGVYDAHDFFLPGGRGAWAKAASETMLGLIFDTYGARMVWAQTPVRLRACRMFNRILGFKSEGFANVRLIPDAEPEDVEIFVMEAAQCH